MPPALSVNLAAMLLTLAFTVVLATIEVVYRSRRDRSLRTYAVWRLVPYFLVFSGGNVVATALVPAVVPDYVRTEYLDPLPGWALPLVYAFLGVFAFSAILSNLTYTAFGRDVGIHDWLARAREAAVAGVIQKQVRAEDERHQRRAHALRDLPEEDLNAQIAHLLGEDAVARLEAAARDNDTAPRLYKALELAAEKPAEADAILKMAAERRGRQTEAPHS